MRDDALSPILSRVVVLGGSLAGLLAAQVMAPYAREVLVVDRDDLSGDLQSPRRGAPQGAHVHAVLARGAEALERLMPGFQAALLARGASVRPFRDGRWQVGGHLLNQESPDLKGLHASRTLIESEVRRRARSTPNITLAGGLDVVTVVSAGRPARVSGAIVAPSVQGSEPHLGPWAVADASSETAAYRIDADLVIDALGRASRASAWLEQLGYARPPESSCPAQIHYSTQHFRHGPGPADDLSAVIIGTHPGSSRGVGAIRTEDDRWAVTLVRQFGERPPTDPEGFAAYAAHLPGQAVLDIIRNGEPIGEPTTYTYPKSRWHHYEKMTKRPRGLIVIGDAVASFNPIYGQGMTSSALQAEALQELLVRHGTHRLEERAAKVFAAKIRNPWALSTGADRRFPGQPVKSWPERGLDLYLDRLLAAASHDPVVALAFMRVLNLLDAPASLLRPSVAARVGAAAVKSRPLRER